ncbi:MAG: hypothetical protein H3C26_15740 [Rhodocyclaceae bacterium]|nr:hypothetical protein [Rhodocyclaceae bacterium]
MNITTDEAARIAGAKACMRALDEMIKSAEAFHDGVEKSTEVEEAAHYYGSRLRDAKAFADAIGPLSPYQEGVIIALAEYIHSSTTTGEPSLELWTPCVALTADQYRKKVKYLAARMAEES